MLFQVALMILKFIEAPLLASNDEAEAIAKLNDFLAELGKKPAQEAKVQHEEETVKVHTHTHTLFLSLLHTHTHTHTHSIKLRCLFMSC